MKKPAKLILKIALFIFAGIGLIFTAVFVGMHFGAFNVRGSISGRNTFFPATPSTVNTPVCTDSAPICEWNETPEWQAIKGGLQKDAPTIARVSTETGISSRMIVSLVIPEQTRFFTANREIFKSYFEPLKILGSLTKFSLGISGIKQDTANDIEKYAADPTSPFYPGAGTEALFAYPDGTSHDAELYRRLTDDKDHYYQYLYTAIFIKEIESQWARSGFDITHKPEVVVTLFNLGFKASSPKSDPQVAGAGITTGGKNYAYGELGSNFYHSAQLSDIFPE